MAQIAKATLTRVAVKEGVRLYTGIGHAPFQPGRHVILPEAHAQALMTSGHVEDPVTAAARLVIQQDAQPAAAPVTQEAAKTAPAPVAVALAAQPAPPAPAAAQPSAAIGPASEPAQPQPAK